MSQNGLVVNLIVGKGIFRSETGRRGVVGIEGIGRHLGWHSWEGSASEDMGLEFVDVTAPNVRATPLADIPAAAHCSLLEAARYLCRRIAAATRVMAFGPHMCVSDHVNAFGRASACGHGSAFGRERWGFGIGVGIVAVGGLQLLLGDAVFLFCSWSVCGRCTLLLLVRGRRR